MCACGACNCFYFCICWLQVRLLTFLFQNNRTAIIKKETGKFCYCKLSKHLIGDWQLVDPQTFFLKNKQHQYTCKIQSKKYVHLVNKHEQQNFANFFHFTVTTNIKLKVLCDLKTRSLMSVYQDLGDACIHCKVKTRSRHTTKDGYIYIHFHKSLKFNM